MAVESSPRAFGIIVRIDVQHDARNFPPVSTFRVGIKQTDIGDRMLLVIVGQQWTVRCQIGDIRIE